MRTLGSFYANNLVTTIRFLVPENIALAVLIFELHMQFYICFDINNCEAFIHIK